MAFKREDVVIAGRGNLIETLSKDLIRTEEEIVKVAKLSLGEATEVDIDKLQPYPEHTYESYGEEEMKELENSIKEYGLMTPIIVWDNGEDDKYIILAGHNRVKAHKNLGYKRIPAIIKKNLSKEEAAIIVNQTNMVQRGFESLGLYSKSSSVHQMKKAREEFKKKHPEFINNDENSSNQDINDKGLKSDIRSIANVFGVSKSTINSYLMLYNTYTKEQFKYFSSDSHKKAFDTSVALIFCQLPKNIIETILRYIDENEVKKLSRGQAKEIVKFYNENKIIDNTALNKNILRYEEIQKQARQEKRQISFKRENLNKYFSDTATDEEIMDEILKLLEEKKSKAYGY